MKIYVIIPVYNCKNYLEQAIKSVLNQLYEHIDIVLVDDGSTDGSTEMCDRLGKEYECVSVVHKANGGVASARNAGLKYIIKSDAKGYVTFLDADDAWINGFLDEEVQELIAQEYDLIGFQSCTCDEEMKRRRNPLPIKEGRFVGGASAIWIHSTQSFAAMLYSVSFIKRYNICFNDSIRYSEDKIFSMSSLYLADKIYIKDRLMYLYRQNKNSSVHIRKRGISYYKPIVDAYIELDKQMKPYVNEKRGIFSAGINCASVYIMDMIDEQLQFYFSNRAIREELEKNSIYRELLDGEGIYENRICPNERYREYTNKTIVYCIKNYIKGCIYRVKNSVLKIPFVYNWLVKKYYNILIENTWS